MLALPLCAWLWSAAEPEEHSQLTAHERDHEAQFHDRGERMPMEWHNAIGFKLIGAGAVPQSDAAEARPLGGMGLFFERTLIEGHLEAEISIDALASAEGTLVPFVVAFKKPFHVGHSFDPFIGLGPFFGVNFGPTRFVVAGGAFTAGFYVWVRERLGLTLVFDYGLGVEGTELVHELAGSFGPVYRF